jgi:hypothetical protein
MAADFQIERVDPGFALIMTEGQRAQLSDAINRAIHDEIAEVLADLAVAQAAVLGAEANKDRI